MHASRIGFGTVLILAAAAGTGRAQDRRGPDRILSITREMTKLGKGAAHAANEAAWGRAIGSSPIGWMAMRSVTGPAEVWFMSGYPSFEAMQKAGDALDADAAKSRGDSLYSVRDADFVNDSRTITASLRPELSYRTDQVSPAAMRYMQVTTVRVRPGHEADFTTVGKAYVAAYTKANVDEPFVIYEVMAGMPGPTYLILVPSRGMEIMDRDMAAQPAVMQAMSDPAGMTKAWTDAVLSIENNVFRISPRMSNLSAEFRASDPAFWNSKK